MRGFISTFRIAAFVNLFFVFNIISNCQIKGSDGDINVQIIHELNLLGLDVKELKLESQEFPLNRTCSFMGVPYLTQPSICIKIFANDTKIKKQIIIWIHIFDSIELSKEFLCQLNEICSGDGQLNPVVFRKNYSGYQRYQDSVILLSHPAMSKKERLKYQRLFDLFENKDSCWTD
jgi:hypothetical protein